MSYGSRREREDRRLWSWQARIEATATVNCFLNAKIAFRGLARTRTRTEAGPTFQIVVDDIEEEMWLG